MRKIKLFVFIFLGLLLFIFSFFLGPQKIQAATPSIVITEIMYDAKGSDDDHEWVEILNLSDDAEISDWKFNDGSNHNLNPPNGESEIWISAGEYLVLADDRNTFLTDYPDFTGQVIDTTMALNNTNDTIGLIDKTGQTIDQVNYQNNWGANGNGRTLEKIDPALENSVLNWQESFVLGGTPGKQASEFTLPNYPDEVFDLINFQYAFIRTVSVSSVIDGDTIKVAGLTGMPSEIRLLGIDSPESGETLFGPAKNFTQQLSGKMVDLVISQDPNEQIDIYNRTLAVVIFEDQVFNTRLLERGLAKYYSSSNSILQSSNWQAIEEQAQNDKIGLWASLGEGVILSELLPNPVGDDSAGEWIELYNPADERLDLSYFLLNGYLIPYGTTITAHGYLVFPRTQTGISLLNSGDTIQLLFPDGLLADETTYGDGGEGWSWAWSKNSWQWTTKATPGKANVIVAPEEEQNEDEKDIPKNSTPIEIKTGEAKNYENYLVRITGEVVETSGNTFYLDDGSGRIKVYIQAATGIDKPEMHKGDIFEIVGIVNLYRGIWRVLPQKQEDIKLIKTAKDDTEESGFQTKKTTSSKSTTTTTKNIASTAAARSPTSKQIASKNQVGVKTSDSGQIGGVSSPFWIQMIKALTGLALVFLVVLLVKLWNMRKNPEFQRPGQGSFGDDFT